MESSSKLRTLYTNRFAPETHAFRRGVWHALWRRVFVDYIRRDDVLLDVGAGMCEFTNVAVARRRIAVDLNPDTVALAAPGVEAHNAAADRMPFLADGEVTVAFASNFFEHAPDKEVLTRIVREIRRVLATGGRLVAMGPNIRLMPGTYWDFFDHHVPLSDRSLCELLRAEGFEIERVIPRFLPASTTVPAPRWGWLVHAYLLARPISSWLFGKQFLVIARKPGARAAS